MAEAKKSTAKKSAAKKAAAKTPVKATAKKTTAKKAVTVPKSATVVKPGPTYQQIAELAHYYWLERGGHHGSDKADWLRAERELRAD